MGLCWREWGEALLSHSRVGIPGLTHVTSLSLSLFIWRVQCLPLSGCHCTGQWSQLPAEQSWVNYFAFLATVFMFKKGNNDVFFDKMLSRLHSVCL